MSTTKKKTKKTSKNTGSRSTKQSQSSKIRSSKSPVTTTQRKKGTLRSEEVSKAENSSLSITTNNAEKKRLLELSQQENLRQKNLDSLKNYDYKNMPELTKKQLKAFSNISPKEHKKFAKADIVKVLKNGEVIENKKVGRPKKNIDEKENIVAIRLSTAFIQKLKERAMIAGNLGWQTYIKKVLEQHLDAAG